MKAIIPVAGSGTRLLPFTKRIQKCLLPVAGKPILAHILEPLLEIGIDEITLITGYFGDQVKQFTKRYTHVRFRFCNQEKRLGLGHAIRMGLAVEESPVLIILGDSIFKLDYRKFIRNPHNRIGVQEVEDPRRFGIVDVRQKKIVRFLEKPDDPPTNLAISGIYYFTSQMELASSIDYLIENNLKTNGEYQLTDAMAGMLEAGSTFSYFHISEWLDCGLPETILSTNKKLLPNSGNSVSSAATVLNSKMINCSIEDSCIVSNSTLNNVILLRGSQVSDSVISNRIVNYNEIIRGVRD